MVIYSADFKANLGSNRNAATLTVSKDESSFLSSPHPSFLCCEIGITSRIFFKDYKARYLTCRKYSIIGRYYCRYY